MLRLNILAPANSLHFTAFANGYARAAGADERAVGSETELYTNAQLAPEQETVGALVSGVIDLAMSPTIYLQGLVPRLRAFDLPFLFKDAAAVFRVLDGPLGNELSTDLEAKGIVALAWGGGGFREFGTTSKAISEPADMRGLRMRFQASPIYTSMSQALGIVPVSVDISELYVALQQHTVDGADLVLDSVPGRQILRDDHPHRALESHLFDASSRSLPRRRSSIPCRPRPSPRPLRTKRSRSAKILAVAYHRRANQRKPSPR